MREIDMTPEKAREELKETFRDIIKGEIGSATATERMRAALALATLDDGVPSSKATYIRHVINGTVSP